MPEPDLVSRLLAAIDQKERRAGETGLESWHSVDCGSSMIEFGVDCECLVPAEIRRLCQAHRDIVELHRADPAEPYSWGGQSCAECSCPNEECLTSVSYPCPTVRLLARGYGIEDGEGNDGQ